MNPERIPTEQVPATTKTHEVVAEKVLKDLAHRIENALRKLLPDIREGAYGVVLGIDASGRVPALMTWQVLNKYHKVPLCFLAGRGQWAGDRDQEERHENERHDYFNNDFFWTLAADNKKVLLVDDTIATGGSIKATCDALTWHGIPFDVVTAGAFVYDDIAAEEQSHADRLGAEHVVIGGGGMPDIYGNKRMSGVQKRRGERHAVAFDRDFYDRAPLGPDDPEVQLTARTVAYTRGRLHEYSDQIFQKLEGESQIK